MCKVVALTNLNKVQDLNKLVNTVAKHVSKYERDGFGYAVQGAKGLFGERTTVPDKFKVSFGRALVNLPFVDLPYNRFGKYSAPKGAGIFHGRTSTNDKTLLNTHPIQKHDWTLIHNGVVSNEGPKYEMFTTNDTEHLVHYIANGGIDALSANLTGYYAAAAFDPQGRLHIFRDDRAPLYIARIDALDSYVVATTADLIESICKDLSLKCSLIGKIHDNTYLVFDRGALVEHRKFVSRGSTARENKYAYLSLGEESSSEYITEGYISESSSPSKFNDERDAKYEDFSRDELAFLDEITFADAGYTFYDHRDRPLTYAEILSMDPWEQLECTVVRPDGTVLDANDIDSNKTFERYTG